MVLHDSFLAAHAYISLHLGTNADADSDSLDAHDRCSGRSCSACSLSHQGASEPCTTRKSRAGIRLVFGMRVVVVVVVFVVVDFNFFGVVKNKSIAFR